MRRTMRRNHRCGVPQHHVCVDTETIPIPVSGSDKLSRHTLRLGVASYFRFEGNRDTRNESVEFLDTNTFWNWLLGKASKRHSLWVWAHNAGFDLTVLKLWQLLECGELSLRDPKRKDSASDTRLQNRSNGEGILVDSDPPTIIVAYTRAGAKIVFIDLMNWFPTSLAEIGKELGCVKLDMPGELAEDSDWATYCGRDVEILSRAVLLILRFVKEADLGNLRWTAASQSMALFRHRCMACPITTDSDAEIKRIERLAYYGGRCEVYFAGAVFRAGMEGLGPLAGKRDGSPGLYAGPVYHLDLTGAYPAAMMNNVYPTRYLSSECYPRIESVRQKMESMCCVASVRVNAGNEPCPQRRNEEVWWVNGEFDTVLCGPELKRAIDYGDVTRIYHCQWYVADKPFTEFVDAVWDLRRRYSSAGNRLVARLCKFIANSLHGKFAQRRSRWTVVPDEIAPKGWGRFVRMCRRCGRLCQFRCVAGFVQHEEEDGEKDDNFPLIAAYCTAYHRERMRDLRLTAGCRQVLYEDADSLHVTQRGKDALDKAGEISDGTLGKLKIEAVADKVVYYGPKDYVFGDRVVCLGLHRKSQCDAKGMWHHTNFDRLPSILEGRKGEGPFTTEEAIERPTHPIRGRVDRDGWVTPIKV